MSVRSASSGTTDLIAFEYTWTIKNIVRLCSDAIMDQPVFYSPTFIAPPDKIVTEDKQPVQFQLSVYPKGINPDHRDFVGIYLELKNRPGLVIVYSHSIVMANGEKRRVSGSIKKFDTKVVGHMSWGVHRGIRCDELLDPANGFVSNDSLIIYCEVNIMNEPDKSDLVDQLQDKYSQPELLATSYGNLLDRGAHSDVTLVMVDDGGQELRAHKTILVARSRVFADMFESKMAESETNRVEIVETHVEVFKQVLHFIYTGKVGTELDGIANDLLICADKYQLDPLKSICEDYLSESISPESDLSDLLALANLHDAPKLQAKVLDSLRKDIETELMNADKLVQIKVLLSSLTINKKD